jgi:hypothetical protein
MLQGQVLKYGNVGAAKLTFSTIARHPILGNIIRDIERERRINSKLTSECQ